ncbi:hypothetical protein D9M72_560460 [compost metagenome]
MPTTDRDVAGMARFLQVFPCVRRDAPVDSGPVGASLLAIAVFSFHADVEGKPGSPARTRRPPGSYRYGVKWTMSSHVGRIARQRYPPSHRRGLVGG